jgi:hypothetical protein
MGFRVLPRCSQDLCLWLLHFTASKLDTVYTITIENAGSAITVVIYSRSPWFESQFERWQHTFKILPISLGLPAKFRHTLYTSLGPLPSTFLPIHYSVSNRLTRCTLIYWPRHSINYLKGKTFSLRKCDTAHCWNGTGKYVQIVTASLQIFKSLSSDITSNVTLKGIADLTPNSFSARRQILFNLVVSHGSLLLEAIKRNFV